MIINQASINASLNYDLMTISISDRRALVGNVFQAIAH
jgi:hypothetical protein